MSKISKFLFILIGGLFLAISPNCALAGYTEIDCPSTGNCPDGYTRAQGVDDGIIWDSNYCVCWKCEGDVDDCEAQHGVMKGCIPLQEKLREAKTCIFCPLFQSLFKAVQTMARQAFDATKDPIRIVMSVGFALYIAFSVLGHVSSLNKQDAPKFITGLLGSTFKFLIAFLLLLNKDTIYYYVINPLLSTALDFGGAMMFKAGEALNECKTDTAGLSGTGDKVLPDELYATMECFIKGVQAEIAFAQAAGSSIMCVGRKQASGAFGIWDFSMVFSGLAIYLCALLLTFAFGFYLIDAVVMLGVIGALMTFFIACWPFKATGGYTSKGFNMFMNIFFTFIFMGIVVSINTQLIKASLSTGGLENLEEVLSGGNIGDSKQILDINGAGFLIILCCCFFGFKFTAKTAQLAGSMAGGGGIDIGARLGGLFTSGAVNSATKVGKTAAAPVAAKAKQVGNAALSGTANFIAHPFKSTRKLAGVATKRWGQAQKAAGAAQGIAGNLAMAAGIKSGADWINKGENLYNQGQANTERGQVRIDKENAGIYGTDDTSSQAQNSTPAPNDSGNADTNQNNGNDNTNNNVDNTNENGNNNANTGRGNTSGGGSTTTANNQRGGNYNGNSGADREGGRTYNYTPRTASEYESNAQQDLESYQHSAGITDSAVEYENLKYQEYLQAENQYQAQEAITNAAEGSEAYKDEQNKLEQMKISRDNAYNTYQNAQTARMNSQRTQHEAATNYYANKRAAQNLREGKDANFNASKGEVYGKTDSELRQMMPELDKVQNAGPRSQE